MRAADVLDGVDHLGDRRAPWDVCGRARRQRSQVAQRDHGEAGAEQEHSTNAEPAHTDDQAGQRGGEHAHPLRGDLGHDDGVGDQARLDELRDVGDASGHEEGERGGLQRAGDEQHPVRDHVELDGDADEQAGHRERRDREEQDGALVESVGGDASPRRGEQHRHAEGEPHAAEPGVAAGEVASEPPSCDGLGHHPEDDKGRGDEQVAVSDRRE